MVALGSLLQGRYRVDALVGGGGMGAVYRAVDLRLGVSVAVKERLGPAGRADAFEREARLLAALRHPCLPRVTDHFLEPDGGQYLVMEFVAGDDLATALAAGEGPVAAPRALAWADRLLDALAYLHGQEPPVVHGDIKPANLKPVGHDGITLLDFGLASAVQAGYTPAYAAPEQLRGEPATPRSDLYALAATLYDLVTGVRPPGAKERRAAVDGGDADPLRPAHELVPALPPALSAVLAKALALDPSKRPESAGAMRRLLAASAEESATTVTSPVPPAAPTPPVPPTTLVGRDAEVLALVELVRQGARLVTLAGPGGVGKTRLALEVAARLLPEFPDGAWFVDLAPVSEPLLVAATVARGLGVREGADGNVAGAVAAWLAAKRALLVLDNFEQVVAAAPFVVDLLAACPALAVLVTSREPLRLRAERTVPVEPLATSAGDDETAPAVALFRQRAAAVGADAASTPEATAAIAGICAALDGLPLAIELAAARLRLFSLAELRERLADRLPLLTGGARDLPARQRTMHDAIAWSYELLTEDERRVFARLAVCSGGCALDAVLAIGSDAGADEVQTLDLIESLVEKSLVRRIETGDRTQLALLETIREFAGLRLAESGEEAEVRRRHATHYLALAERADARRAGWLARLDAERANIDAALAWLRRTGDARGLLRLAAALWPYWEVRGNLTAGRAWLETALAGAPDAPPALRALALRGAGSLARSQGDFAAAEAAHAAGLALSRAANDDRGAASALNNLAVVASDQGRYDRARGLYAEALALFEALGDRANIALALNNLGVVDVLEGRSDEAARRYEASLAHARAIEDRRGEARTLANLGSVERFRGDWDGARRRYDEALATFEALGDRQNVAYVLNCLGAVALNQGDAAGAGELYERALAGYRELGDRRGIAAALHNLGDVAMARGDPAGAAERYRASLRSGLGPGDPELAALSLGALAGAIADREGAPLDELALAARLLALREHLRETNGAPIDDDDRARVDERIARLRAALGAERLDAAWATGRSLSVEQALACATREEGPR